MKKITAILYFAIILILGFATILETKYGHRNIEKFIYGSWWFISLIFLAITSGGYILIRKKTYKKPAICTIHLALVIIMAGGMLTKITAERGTIHLKYNDPASEMMAEYTENNNSPQMIRLPFHVALDTFQISYYPGTNAPSDYFSYINIKNGSENIKGIISVNNIFKYKGYRFYQSYYDPNLRGTWLSVYKDDIGIPVTYTGYALLFLSLILAMFNRKGRFKTLTKLYKTRATSILTIILLLCSITTATATTPETLSRQQLDTVKHLKVYYQNDINPLNRLANDFTKKLTGNNSYGKYTGMQFFTGIVFFPETWKNEHLFHIENNVIKERFHLNENACINDFYTKEGKYILQPYWHLMHKSGRKSNFLKELEQIDEKIQIINMASSGQLLKIYPVRYRGKTLWYPPKEQFLPENTNKGYRLFIQNSFNIIYTSILDGNNKQFNYLIGKHIALQKKYIPNDKLNKIRIWCRNTFITIPFYNIHYRFSLTAGMIFLILSVTAMMKRRKSIRLERIQTATLALLFFSITFMLFLIGAGGNKWPMSNGPETMSFMAWSVIILAFIIRKRSPLILSFGFLIAGFGQLVAAISTKSPQISPLVPVLSSPLLSLHVSFMMIAYALSGFTFLIAVTSLILSANKTESGIIAGQIKELTVLSNILLHFLVVFLSTGIFIGAIWGNISWGRYWGWDPKEVWALINLMVYAAIIHIPVKKHIENPSVYHILMIIGTLTVLFTYFGVNYILGGMHSYA